MAKKRTKFSLSLIAKVLAVTFSLLFVFCISTYLLVIAYYMLVWPDVPQTALEKGELYVRGVIYSKDNEIVALRRENCSADDCHMLFNKEVLIRRSELDAPYQIGEKVVIHLDKHEALPDYRRSEIQDGLLNKQIFTIRSMEQNKFDLGTVDKGKISTMITAILASLITGAFFGLLSWVKPSKGI